MSGLAPLPAAWAEALRGLPSPSVNSFKVKYIQAKLSKCQSQARAECGANAWHLLCRSRKLWALGGSLPKRGLITCRLTAASQPGREVTCPGYRPSGETGRSVEESHSSCPLALPEVPPDRGGYANGPAFSVFKATPTLWRPTAAATPDSLPAMAISSQVSVCLRGL